MKTPELASAFAAALALSAPLALGALPANAFSEPAMPHISMPHISEPMVHITPHISEPSMPHTSGSFHEPAFHEEAPAIKAPSYRTSGGGSGNGGGFNNNGGHGGEEPEHFGAPRSYGVSPSHNYLIWNMLFNHHATGPQGRAQDCRQDKTNTANVPDTQCDQVENLPQPADSNALDAILVGSALFAGAGLGVYALTRRL